MIFDRNEKKQVVALLGAGSMGTAIVRRIGAGKKILLGDISEQALERVGEDFRRCGYDVETIQVNALQKESVEAFARKAAELGPVMYFIDTAGASPNQAKPEHIVDLDMVGTGYAVDAFGEVMAEGGAGLIISSQAAYMYPIPNDIELQLVNTPTAQRGHAEQRLCLYDSQAHEPPAGTAGCCHELAQASCSHQHHLSRHHRHPTCL